jgi:hypothetical protein
MSDVFALSRPALYELAKRVKQRLLSTTEPFALPAPEKQASTVAITPTRKADTWGAALLIAQEQGVTIGGLARR